jgi:hypothetical protein
LFVKTAKVAEANGDMGRAADNYAKAYLMTTNVDRELAVVFRARHDACSKNVKAQRPAQLGVPALRKELGLS